MQHEITIELTTEQQKALATEFGENFESLTLTVVGGKILAFFNRSPSHIMLTAQQKAFVKENIGKEIEEVFFSKLGAGAWGATWPMREYRGLGEDEPSPGIQGAMCIKKGFPRKWPALRDTIKITPEADRVLGDFRDRFLQSKGTIGAKLGGLFNEIEVELITVFTVNRNFAIEANEIIQMNAPLLNAAVQLKSFPNAQGLGLNVIIPEAHVNKATTFLDNLAEAANPDYKESITYTGQLIKQLIGRTLLEATTLLDMPYPNA